MQAVPGFLQLPIRPPPTPAAAAFASPCLRPPLPPPNRPVQVVSLHDMYARLESSGAAPAGSSGSDHSALTTGQRGAASPTHSHCS